jgi:hypothetical protein
MQETVKQIYQRNTRRSNFHGTKGWVSPARTLKYYSEVSAISTFITLKVWGGIA